MVELSNKRGMQRIVAEDLEKWSARELPEWYLDVESNSNKNFVENKNIK